MSKMSLQYEGGGAGCHHGHGWRCSDAQTAWLVTRVSPVPAPHQQQGHRPHSCSHKKWGSGMEPREFTVFGTVMLGQFYFMYYYFILWDKAWSRFTIWCTNQCVRACIVCIFALLTHHDHESRSYCSYWSRNKLWWSRSCEKWNQLHLLQDL